MAGQTAFLAHMLFEDAETSGEFDLLRRGDLLVAEKNHLIVKKSLGNLRENVVAQRLAQVRAGNFCADVFADAGYGNHSCLLWRFGCFVDGSHPSKSLSCDKRIIMYITMLFMYSKRG